jgi:hypothetical protein
MLTYDNERSEKLLQSIADALWGEGADEAGSGETLDAIIDAISLYRDDLIKARFRDWH